MDKMSSDAQISMLQGKLKTAELVAKMTVEGKKLKIQDDFNYDKLHMDAALKLVDIEAKAKTDETANLIKAQAIVSKETKGDEND
jgi:5-methylcytosine-specific restriction endonuclease McrBC regulatory subunit McrC